MKETKKKLLQGNNCDFEKAGQREPGDHQKQRRDSESRDTLEEKESRVEMESKWKEGSMITVLYDILRELEE